MALEGAEWQGTRAGGQRRRAEQVRGVRRELAGIARELGTKEVGRTLGRSNLALVRSALDLARRGGGGHGAVRRCRSGSTCSSPDPSPLGFFAGCSQLYEDNLMLLLPSSGLLPTREPGEARAPSLINLLPSPLTMTMRTPSTLGLVARLASTSATTSTPLTASAGPLPSRAILHVSGLDAPKFLNGVSAVRFPPNHSTPRPFYASFLHAQVGLRLARPRLRPSG